MKILVYGAGVIGTLYAARLQEGGHRVTVVARGQRLADIRRYGLALEDIVGQGRSTTQVDTTERLGPNDQYDIALIAVRRDKVASVVPELTANHRIPTLIFMLNNPTGSSDLAQALGGSLPILEHEQVMRCSESLQPLRKSLLEFFERVHGASRLGGDRLDNREQVFGAMGDFAHKEFDMLLRDLAIGHICHDVD